MHPIGKIGCVSIEEVKTEVIGYRYAVLDRLSTNKTPLEMIRKLLIDTSLRSLRRTGTLRISPERAGRNRNQDGAGEVDNIQELGHAH